MLKERARTFGEADALLEGELAFLFVAPEVVAPTLRAKEPLGRPGFTKEAMEALQEPIKGLPEGISADEVRDMLMPLADAEEARGKGRRGAMLWPLRYALSGQERSPDPFTIISIIGVQESLARIEKAIAILGG